MFLGNIISNLLEFNFNQFGIQWAWHYLKKTFQGLHLCLLACRSSLILASATRCSTWPSRTHPFGFPFTCPTCITLPIWAPAGANTTFKPNSSWPSSTTRPSSGTRAFPRPSSRSSKVGHCPMFYLSGCLMRLGRNYDNRKIPYFRRRPTSDQYSAPRQRPPGGWIQD